MTKKKKILMLGIVLDATLSFSTVYPQVYYFLNQLFIQLRYKKDNQNIEIIYSISLLHDQPELLDLTTVNTHQISEEEIVERLSQIEFWGGDDHGRENLNEVVMLQLEQLNQLKQDFVKQQQKQRVANPDREDYQQQILVFTDSCEEDEKQYPDYSKQKDSCFSNVNYGIQRGYIYSHKATYMPKLRIVNEKGLLVEDDRYTCLFGDIAEFLQMNEEETIKTAEKLADSILQINSGKED